MNKVVDASRYLLTVEQLSQKSVVADTKQETMAKPAALPSYIASIPYAPFILAGTLFIVAFIVVLAGKIRSAKQVFTALVIALFAASIPAALPYLQQGIGQETHAGPQTQPKKLSVQYVSPITVQMLWHTDIPTVGGVRVWESTSDNTRAQIRFSNNRVPTTDHSVAISNMVEGTTYSFDILSDSLWYGENKDGITFIFK